MKPTPTEYMKKTRDNYEKLGFEPYSWFTANEPAPFCTPSKPLSESKLGMISTAGTYLHGQVAYYYKDDTSIRAIPRQAAVKDLRFSHIMENYLVEARQDPGKVFPSEALNTLQARGDIGELADNFFSCMGGIYSTRRVKAELIPNLEVAVERERLDLLLLVPL